jgi:hypothetical protein
LAGWAWLVGVFSSLLLMQKLWRQQRHMTNAVVLFITIPGWAALQRKPQYWTNKPECTFNLNSKLETKFG